MTDTPIVDTQVLREQVREKYRAVDVGSGAGVDSFVAAHHVGPDGVV